MTRRCKFPESRCFPPPAPTSSPTPTTTRTPPLVKATGFREYDARWLFGPEINLLGIQALGLGLGTYIHELGQTRIVVGHDYRSYSLSIKQALTLGLVAAGCEVLDIGLALSPMAYFAQFDLDAPCVAMVTASHNENGWTGVKMGAQRAADLRPRRDGPAEGDRARRRPGSSGRAAAWPRSTACAERYIADAAVARQHQPAAEGGRRLRQRHRRRLRARGPAPHGRGRGGRDGLRARLDLPASTIRTRKTSDMLHAMAAGGARARRGPGPGLRRRRRPLRRGGRRGRGDLRRQDRPDAGPRPVAACTRTRPSSST